MARLTGSAAAGLLVCVLCVTGAGCSEARPPEPVAAPPAAPQGLRLAGDIQKGNQTWHFEIIMDGTHYCRREWWRDAWDETHGSNSIEIVLPYWSGIWSPGGKQYGYHNCRNDFAPARRLWPAGGLAGASKNRLKFRAPHVEEEFSDLKPYGGVSIPGRIQLTTIDYGIEKNEIAPHDIRAYPPKVYLVKEVELLYTPQAEVIMGMKRRYFGDTRYKAGKYPDGTKYSDYVYDGELPVLEMEFDPQGHIAMTRAYSDGLLTTEIRWHPNGQKQQVSFWRDGEEVSWTVWSADGKKVLEGKAPGARAGKQGGGR